jgi:tight adherence protein C
VNLALIIAGGLLVATGVGLAATAIVPGVPPLNRAVANLHRPPLPPVSGAGRSRAVDAVVRSVAGRLTGVGLISELQLAGRPLEVHAAYLVAGVLIGLLAPLAVVLALTLSGMIAVPWVVPLGVIVLGGAAGCLWVQVDLRQRAQAASRDLRHQLSAYVDVLTMLLAANMGNEGALRLAADAGDGRLFTELRRRIAEAGKAGRPAVTGLAALGRELRLVELMEIAASASLATSQGAPVARSLAAKTQSLRAALQAEQEEDARIRTGKITFPLVAMGIVFMVMGLYPALAGIQGG